MASAWGKSWGKSWGNSWGVLAPSGVQAPSGARRLAVIELVQSIEAKQKEAFAQGIVALFEESKRRQKPEQRGNRSVAESLATDTGRKRPLETGEGRVAPARTYPSPGLEAERQAAERYMESLRATVSELMAQPYPAMPDVVEFNEEEELALLMMLN